MKFIEAKAGERQRIIHRFSNSVKTTYHFTARPLNPDLPLSGNVEVAGSRWIFPKPAVTQNLLPENTVNKGMWDTFYSVYVVPDCDVNITLAPTAFSKAGIYLAIAVAIIAVVVFFLLMAP